MFRSGGDQTATSAEGRRNRAAPSKELVIGNRLAEMAKVERWLAELLQEWAVPPRTVYAVDLVVNEALANIINYAYPEGDAHSIRIALSNSVEAVLVEIEDDGLPFDPLSAPPMPVAADLEHAAIGGRGIHLIKRYADEQYYDFVASKNRLKLVLQKKN